MPPSWSPVNVEGSSTSARGFPSVCSSNASATWSGEQHSGALAEQGSRRFVIEARDREHRDVHRVNVRESPTRALNTRATGSASRRREAKTSASAVVVSSQRASSIRHRTGLASAASVSIARVASPTRNGSTRLALLLPEGHPQGSSLRGREPVDQGEHRPEKLVQPGEGQRALDSRPCARRIAHVPERVRAGLQQGGLPDVGSTAHDKGSLTDRLHPRRAAPRSAPARAPTVADVGEGNTERAAGGCAEESTAIPAS